MTPDLLAASASTHGWTAPDGAKFAYSRWGGSSAEKTRALVVCVHGLSGAACDFAPLGLALVPRGFVVLALELRGQGSDPVARRRGDLGTLVDWYADVRAFIALARAAYPEIPLILYGESMGAALLVRYLAQAAPEEEPRALILASPVIALKQEPSGWQQFLFRFFLAVRPTHRIDVRKLTRPKKGVAPPLVTRDEAHLLWIETAPHRVTSFTIRFFKNLHELISGCLADAPKLRMPILLLYAQHDIFIPPALIDTFFDRIGSSDKTKAFYPESYHLLLHDHDRAKVLTTIEGWLDARF